MLDKGREFRSKPFVIQKRRFVSAEALKERYFAQVLIRGYQMPYSVEFYVYQERKQSDGRYQVVGKNARIADVMRVRFEQQLVKGREDLNLIDDFRAF